MYLINPDDYYKSDLFLSEKENKEKYKERKRIRSEEMGEYVVVIGNEMKIGMNRVVYVKNMEMVDEIFKIRNNRNNISIDKWAEKIRISFSLINMDPESHLISWEFEKAKIVLNNFINKISMIYPNLYIDSQIINNGMLPYAPIKKNDKWIIEQDKMKFLLNKNNWILDSVENNDEEQINFILLVPPLKNSPLFIDDEEYDYYVIPRWGGIVLYNYLEKEDILLDHNDLHEKMEVFLKMLRKLFNVEFINDDNNGIKIEENDIDGINKFELDRLIRLKNYKYTKNAIKSLFALDKTIKSFKKLRIGKEVKKNVVLALEHLEQTEKFTKLGDYEKSIFHSRLALLYAERAYFEPSITSSLYFATNQKLAVFLPVLIPFVMKGLKSFIDEVRRRRFISKQLKKKEKKE